MHTVALLAGFVCKQCTLRILTGVSVVSIVDCIHISILHVPLINCTPFTFCTVNILLN